jgi:hypothetical protein
MYIEYNWDNSIEIKLIGWNYVTQAVGKGSFHFYSVLAIDPASSQVTYCSFAVAV